MSKQINTEDIKRKIDLIYNTFDELLILSKESKQELSNLDREFSNQYHIIEGTDLQYMSDSHLLIIKLRDILFRRREAKLTHTILESFVGSLEPNIGKSHKRYCEIIDKHKEIIQEIIDRAK